MKSFLHNLVLFSLFFAFVLNTSAEAKKKNVLFLAIDDLNDWIGCLGGHPQVKTPNLDKLAARGTLFTNAHCQAPVCNPSRTSVLLGLRPSTTGIYSLQPSFKKGSEVCQSCYDSQGIQSQWLQYFDFGKDLSRCPTQRRI